jgi:large subunit ribosomal protein L25
VLRSLSVRAKPNDIPVKLVVDVSPLEIGDVIHVSSIELPAGVSSVTGRDLAVVTCAAPEEDKTPAATEAATAEGAAAAAAPAAAAAAPAGKDAKAAAPAKDAKGAPAGKAAPAAAKPATKK